MGDTELGSGDLDVTQPNTARMYDFYLGGRDNFAVDREAAQEILRLIPFTPAIALQNRRFLSRAVRYLMVSDAYRHPPIH